MAITRVAAAGVGSDVTGTREVLTHGMTLTTSGDLIVLVFNVNNPSATSSDGNDGNDGTDADVSFTKRATFTAGTPAELIEVWTWVTNGTDTPTAFAMNHTGVGAQRMSLCAYQLRGADTTTFWDVDPSNAGTQNNHGSTGSQVTSNSMTLSDPNAMGFAIFSQDNSTTTFSGYDQSYINELEVTGDPAQAISIVDRIYTSSGSKTGPSATPSTTAVTKTWHFAVASADAGITIEVPTGPWR